MPKKDHLNSVTETFFYVRVCKYFISILVCAQILRIHVYFCNMGDPMQEIIQILRHLYKHSEHWSIKENEKITSTPPPGE